MFRSEKQVSIGLIVGLGAAASAALAALYVLYKKDDENFELDPRLEVTTSSFHTIRSTTIHKSVPKEAIGAVIGKGGEVIKLVQRKTNTKINFLNGQPNDDVDRIITIKGSSTGVLEADEMIDQIIASALSCINKKIYIDASEVGLVIGRSGSTIKSISEESGAKVSITKNVRKSNTGRVPVEIRGEAANVETAIKMIDEKLRTSKFGKYVYRSNTPRNQSNGHSYISFIPSHYNINSLTSTVMFERLESNFDNGCIDVYVSSVQNPSKFYVQPCGSNSADLDRLMVEMTDFYERPENRLKAKLDSIAISDIAAAPLRGDEHYYRVKIVAYEDTSSLSDETEVSVFYLDFGNESIVQKSELCVLHEDFLFKLPFQAIECSLFGVSPISDSDWSNEAIDYFKKLTRETLWEKIFAKPVKATNVDKEPREKYSVTLIDLKGDMDLNIAQDLIEKGFAVSNDS